MTDRHGRKGADETQPILVSNTLTYGGRAFSSRNLVLALDQDPQMLLKLFRRAQRLTRLVKIMQLLRIDGLLTSPRLEAIWSRYYADKRKPSHRFVNRG